MMQASLLRAQCAYYNAYYRLRYRRFLQRSSQEKILFAHPPKTAGRAIAKALEIPDPGHFSFDEAVAMRTVALDKIVFTTRDPVDRLVSIFKMPRNARHNKRHSPIYPLLAFDTVEEFVASTTFDVFVERHYFFRPQRFFIQGALEHEASQKHWLRFEHLARDCSEQLGIELEHVNSSPALNVKATGLSDKARAKVENAYADDFKLLDELARWKEGATP